MKIKKLVSMFLIVAMVACLFAACGGKEEEQQSSGTNTSGSAEATKAPVQAGENTIGGSAEVETPNKYADTMVIENFNVAANYQGVQSGWFAKVIKDRFNIELNIIAPQVGGDALYQTRTASGNLGDLLLLEKAQFQDCVATGLVKDITDRVYTGALGDYKTQIDALNADYAGKIYGIPTEMMNTSPTTVSSEDIYSSVRLRWDIYNQVGAPTLNTTEDLLDCLEAMVEAAPVNDNGDPCYAMSLWPDWDGGDNMIGIANVVQLTTWYGEKIKQSLILKPDDTFIPLTDKSGAYYKVLKFLNDANRRGIVDPESATQGWSEACAKMGAGQVYLEWYSWQVGFWSVGHMQDGRAHRVIPVAEHKYYADADSYYGSGRVFCIGAGVDDAKYERIMDFLDWYSSPEGLMFQHSGIEGFNYYKGEDGRLYTMNESALSENTPVPEEWGGAGYNDGNNMINQWTVGAGNINPLTGETYSTQLWSTYKEKTDTQMVKDWRAKFNAENPVDYFNKNNQLVVSPNISVPLKSDTPDIQVIRNQCNECVCDASWQMIYAESDEEFEALWDEMTATLDGLGFQELMAWDREVYTVELEAKKAAR